MRTLLLLIALGLFAAADVALAASARRLEIVRADDSVLKVAIFDRRAGAGNRALLLVQGSDCRRAEAHSWLSQALAGASVRWVVMVEKDGAAESGDCGPVYESHATEEARWFDHLVAMRRLKTELGLREKGAFQVLAVSAGGLTGCAMAGASSDVGALALLGTGGGMTFDQELDKLTKGDARLAAERRRIRTDPRLGKTWLGSTNPEIWWWSVLSKRCLPLLNGYSGPLLVVHGARDSSTPVESARTLVAGVRRPNVTYVELDTDHDLGLTTLPPEQNGVARALAWLRTR